MTLDELDTPALVLDLEKLRTNCRRMITVCGTKGVGLRAHMKTLKSAEAARVAIDPAHGGIAVATLNEAEYFAHHGVTDIQLAVCLPPTKVARAAAVARRAPRFSFFIDSVDAALAVAHHARDTGESISTWIEIDCGEHRTGLSPEDPRVLEIAGILAASGAKLAGVATHAGHSYSARSIEDAAAIADAERKAVVAAAERLRAAGHDVPGVSAGSTPTALHGTSAAGLTELRAGVYMAGDLFQTNLHSHDIGDIAVTVLATVISHDRARGRIMIDAGGLALSKDRSTAKTPERDFGYGLVLDVSGTPRFGALCVNDVHQEHGAIVGRDLPFEALPIGAKLRVAPNHVCMTAAMYGRYQVVNGDDAIVDVWDRTNGWEVSP